VASRPAQTKTRKRMSEAETEEGRVMRLFCGIDETDNGDIRLEVGL
jgi:hypothetical protein